MARDRFRSILGDNYTERDKQNALTDAAFGCGPLAGRTGDVFKDDPFFNPWAKGGAFDRSSGTGGGAFNRSSDAGCYSSGDWYDPEESSVFVLTDQASERVKKGSLILISPREEIEPEIEGDPLILIPAKVDVLTPIEKEVFTRCFEARNIQRGLKATGFSRTFNMASTELSSPEVHIPEDLVPSEPGGDEVLEYIVQRRQERLLSLEYTLGSYLSDEDRELLKGQNPSFESRRNHEIVAPVKKPKLPGALDPDEYRYKLMGK